MNRLDFTLKTSMSYSALFTSFLFMTIYSTTLTYNYDLYSDSDCSTRTTSASQTVILGDCSELGAGNTYRKLTCESGNVLTDAYYSESLCSTTPTTRLQYPEGQCVDWVNGGFAQFSYTCTGNSAMISLTIVAILTLFITL